MQRFDVVYAIFQPKYFNVLIVAGIESGRHKVSAGGMLIVDE